MRARRGRAWQSSIKNRNRYSPLSPATYEYMITLPVGLKPSAIRCKHRPRGLYVSKPQLLYSWAHRCKPSGNLSSGPAANAPIYSRVLTSSAILMLSNSLPDPPICLPGPLHSTFPFIATIHIALAGSSPTLAASSPGSNPIIANHSERVVCLITRSAG